MALRDRLGEVDLRGIDVGKFKTMFPFTVDVPKCEDCSTLGRPVYMNEKYVRDPHTQSHWRGVRAFVCPECEKAIRADDPAEARGIVGP